MSFSKMDAEDKKNNAGEQVHLSNKKDNMKMGLRRGSLVAGFRTSSRDQKIKNSSGLVSTKTGWRFWL